MFTIRYFFDTEFHDVGEIGERIEPISIGIVREDGATFYEVCDWFDYEAAESNFWLKNNVLDRLDKPRDEWLSRDEIRDKLTAFFKESKSFRENNELWAWYASYDFNVLVQLFGGYSKLPPYVPYYVMDVRQEYQRLGNPKLRVRNDFVRNDKLHNALVDALECKERHELIVMYEDRVNTRLLSRTDS